MHVVPRYRRSFLFAILLAASIVWVAGCGSVRPDFVYKSPFVRVYAIDDSAAVPPATTDRYLSSDELEAVDLDTVEVDVFERTDTLRPYREMAVLHLTISDGMYAYETEERGQIANDLLRKAAAIIGSDAAVILQRETKREDETVANAEGPPDPPTRGDDWAGGGDRSREEWRDDWRESKRYSVRAMALVWQDQG